jgi:hypothetical protein
VNIGIRLWAPFVAYLPGLTTMARHTPTSQGDGDGLQEMKVDSSSITLDQWPFELFLYFTRFLDATDLLTLRLVSQVLRT